MLAGKAVGRNASTQKYDILTALGTFALAQDKGLQRLALRLMVLITARYNWRLNELSMGQREIARLWAVNERTVKREMAKLRNLSWLSVKTPAARGRVATYAIDFHRISTATQKNWPSVGPDFVERMAELYPANVVKIDFGRGAGQGAQPIATPEPTGQWGEMRSLLRAQDESVFQNWFARLRFVGFAEGKLELAAESSFLARYIETHLSRALMSAAIRVFGPVETICFTPG
ncbi:MAG TPA: hypothetical protein EYG79_01085 [Rhodobacteraceae bacterium]|nr:hypothetical protein [Paracoccaceae bacterium]